MEWSTLTSGKFFSSGTVMFDPEDQLYKDARLIKAINPEWVSALYDTVTLRSRGYNYKSDDEAYLYVNDSSLRVSLDKAVCFLPEQERTFLLSKFNEAYSKCLEYCESDMFASFVIVTPPGKRAPKHKHSNLNTLTFTYVIRSNDSVVNSGLNIEKADGEMYNIPFPTSSDFFFLFDSSTIHGTSRCEDDDNSYIYFVFDGVKLKNNALNILQMYSVTK